MNKNNLNKKIEKLANLKRDAKKVYKSIMNNNFSDADSDTDLDFNSDSNNCYSDCDSDLGFSSDNIELDNEYNDAKKIIQKEKKVILKHSDILNMNDLVKLYIKLSKSTSPLLDDACNIDNNNFNFQNIERELALGTDTTCTFNLTYSGEPATIWNPYSDSDSDDYSDTCGGSVGIDLYENSCFDNYNTWDFNGAPDCSLIIVERCILHQDSWMYDTTCNNKYYRTAKARDLLKFINKLLRIVKNFYPDLIQFKKHNNLLDK